MEEKVVLEALKQVPSLAMLVVVVVIFIRYLGKRDDYHRQRFQEFVGFLDVCHQDHLEARRESRDAIKENTKATNELNKTMVDLRIQLRNGK